MAKKKTNKYAFWSSVCGENDGFTEQVAVLQANTRQNLINKFYNL